MDYKGGSRLIYFSSPTPNSSAPYPQSLKKPWYPCVTNDRSRQLYEAHSAHQSFMWVIHKWAEFPALWSKHSVLTFHISSENQSLTAYSCRTNIGHHHCNVQLSYALLVILLLVSVTASVNYSTFPQFHGFSLTYLLPIFSSAGRC